MRKLLYRFEVDLCNHVQLELHPVTLLPRLYKGGQEPSPDNEEQDQYNQHTGRRVLRDPVA